MNDGDGYDTPESEARWVYRVVRRELPAQEGGGARFALDQWVRERERGRLVEVSTRLPSQRPLGHRRSLVPASMVARKTKHRGRPSVYGREQVRPYHGLYRLVRIVRTATGESFAVHAVCGGPYCSGEKVRVFSPYMWIVSGESLNGCMQCSQRARRARARAEQAARDGDVKGLAS